MQVNELFLSVQGEGQDSGFPCTFVRFTGCNIRCTYCDTAYAFYEGDEASLDEVMDRIEALGAERVCLTGGEPMLQPDLPELMDRLLATGKRVILETGGVIDLKTVPDGVIKVVDIKTPEALPYDKGEAGPRFTKRHFHYPNLELLTDHDQVKFVICSRKDYEWVKSFIEAHAHVLPSPKKNACFSFSFSNTLVFRYRCSAYHCLRSSRVISAGRSGVDFSATDVFLFPTDVARSGYK